ncbi:vacuolar ATP synthase subunit H, putative [Entamoeba invadens IP1]|uniref:vacuolar ATP synthase subunit H, putative n=1 Tax=Entamoeba invadens IP1 TaxID=370355 RepID=UPI0002C3CF06|nr:vacuolar ATP synthase subunit H, putative [Entamoeba invadens IP1]ELP93829.1 vacuolar ATP synthase subunit H, putative [Entamoeba invadens IP1]|eukprot:XP_004260600.1 vacuolar ATP synthase subunit H, putative [Entamoeba invadens IP1]
MFHTPALNVPPISSVFQQKELDNAINNNASLSNDNKSTLTRYLGQAEVERAKIKNEMDLKTLISIFYTLLIDSEHPAVIENTTLLLQQFIAADNNRVPLFAEMEIKKTVEVCSRLIRLMKTDNLTILESAISVYTTLATTTGTFADFAPIMSNYFQIIRGIYTQNNQTKQGFQLLHLFNWSLFVLLNKQTYREVFANEIPLGVLSDSYDKLVATSDNDLVYGMFHVVWLMTFDEKLVEHGFPENFISIFTNIFLKFKVEKLMRIVLMIIHNILQVDWYIRLLVQHDFNRIIPVLKTRTYTDADIKDLLEEIGQVIEKKVTETTSIQCYLDELKSNTMRWSPMHRSEQFWVENVTAFEGDNWALVRKLKNVINDKSADPVCVSVACFDLGEVARYHPLGRKVMNDLGVKMDLLQLTTSDNAEIKKNAIYAVQKIMLHHWDLVQQAANAE